MFDSELLVVSRACPETLAAAIVPFGCELLARSGAVTESPAGSSSDHALSVLSMRVVSFWEGDATRTLERSNEMWGAPRPIKSVASRRRSRTLAIWLRSMEGRGSRADGGKWPPSLQRALSCAKACLCLRSSSWTSGLLHHSSATLMVFEQTGPVTKRRCDGQGLRRQGPPGGVLKIVAIVSDTSCFF